MPVTPAECAQTIDATWKAWDDGERQRCLALAKTDMQRQRFQDFDVVLFDAHVALTLARLEAAAHDWEELLAGVKRAKGAIAESLTGLRSIPDLLNTLGDTTRLLSEAVTLVEGVAAGVTPAAKP